MKIGIPKEIKNNENRVGMTPAGVAEFIRHGHEVMVQHTAGENSGFADEEYEKVGARILPDIQSGSACFYLLPFCLRQRAHRCHDQERCSLSGLRDGRNRQPSSATAHSDE